MKISTFAADFKEGRRNVGWTIHIKSNFIIKKQQFKIYVRINKKRQAIG